MRAGELDAALHRLGLHGGAMPRKDDTTVVDSAQTVWVSSAMRGIREVVEQIGDTDVTVLIRVTGTLEATASAIAVGRAG